jgi:adenylate kinase family enzyme
MRRIVILGCSGTGKSTLARRLARQLALPVVHLDMLYWRPGWQHPDPEDFRARVAGAVAGEDWISDGNYSVTFDLRLPRADAVIIMTLPRWRRLLRVFRRQIFQRHTRPDLPEGCPERVDWELLC